LFRQFLYSKWFFGCLLIVSLLDISADLAEEFWGWNKLNILAIGIDLVVAGLCAWIFIDLHRRRPKDGGGPNR
jgi:hypothetical protein